MPEAVPTRSGYVAILGRPNVGKSTLMNRVLAEKISIVSFKPQTTRNRILGILSTATFQMLFLDTPGVHGRKAAGIDGFMLDQAWSAAGDADVVLFLTEAESPRELDRAILDRAAQLAAPKVAAINKIDAMRDRKRLLPKIEALAVEGFAEIVPISATKGEGVADLVGLLAGLLPEGPRYYEDDQLTDSTMRFVAAEIIREKIFYAAREEIPYSIAVAIEEYKDRPDGSAYIHAVIWVEKDSQKGIVIGKGGAMLKKIGEQARAEIETLQQGRVFLRLHVVVKKNWTKDPAALRDLGYKV